MYFVITKFCKFLHVVVCTLKNMQLERSKRSRVYVQCFQYGGLFTAQEWPEGSLPLIPEKGQFAILDTERVRVLSVEPSMGSAREMTRPGVHASS
jgi:hypothetical protein